MSSERVVHIVDDDMDFRQSLARLLEAAGYTTTTFASGSAFVAVAPRLSEGCVLLDLQMPVMNGREMLQRMRATPELKDVPVVIISGFGFEWEAELMGAQGYIGKPFEPAELEKTIANLLRPKLVAVKSPDKPAAKSGQN